MPIASHSKYGPLEITDEQLANAAANKQAGVPNGTPINLDHMYGEAGGWFDGFVHQQDCRWIEAVPKDRLVASQRLKDDPGFLQHQLQWGFAVEVKSRLAGQEVRKYAGRVVKSGQLAA